MRPIPRWHLPGSLSSLRRAIPARRLGPGQASSERAAGPREGRLKLTSVRLRLALWNTGVLALALGGFAAAIQYTVQANLAASTDNHLRDGARMTQDRLTFHWEHEGPFGPPFPGPPGPVRFGSAPPAGPDARPSGGPDAFRGGPHGPGDAFHEGPPPGGPVGFGGGPPPGDGKVIFRVGPPPGDGASVFRGGPPRDRDDFGGRPPGGHDFERIAGWRRLGPLRGPKGMPPPRTFDPKGQPLSPFSQDKPWDRASLSRALHGAEVFSTPTVDGEPTRVLSSPLRINARIVGAVQLAQPLTETRRLLRNLARTLWMLIPLALAAAGLGGIFLTDRALRPVRQISQAASRLGAEDLSQRLPETGGDEFAELAASFNRMFGRLDEAFAALASAYERQRQFTADASHELRTPLTTIKANTSLALFGSRSVEEYRLALSSVDRAADRMNRIVRDLLQLARSDNGELGLERRPVRLAEAVEQAVAEVGGPAEGAPIRCEGTDVDAWVEGDLHALVRVLVNLLENARRHTPAEGEVVVSIAPAGDRCEVRVEDTGEGIPPEHLPRLCERFYRVDTARSRAQGGSGLGLAICRSLVEGHGGTLEITSEVGRGTTVIVSLPAAAAPVEMEGLASWPSLAPPRMT